MLKWTSRVLNHTNIACDGMQEAFAQGFKVVLLIASTEFPDHACATGHDFPV